MEQLLTENQIDAITKWTYNQPLDESEKALLEEGLIEWVKSIPEKIRQYRLEKLVVDNFYNPETNSIVMFVNTGDEYYEYHFEKTVWTDTLQWKSDEEVAERRRKLIKSGFTNGYNESTLSRIGKSIMRKVLKGTTFVSIILAIVMIGFALYGVAMGAIAFIVGSGLIASFLTVTAAGSYLIMKSSEKQAEVDAFADTYDVSKM